jgi:ABC-type dipeptide/oligopeptide/nickel transport system permease component
MKNKFLATVFLTSFGICSLNAESIGMFEAYSMALNNSHEAKSLDYQLQADEELVSQAYSQILPQVTTLDFSTSIRVNKSALKITCERFIVLSVTSCST